MNIEFRKMNLSCISQVFCVRGKNMNKIKNNFLLNEIALFYHVQNCFNYLLIKSSKLSKIYFFIVSSVFT